MLLEEVLEAKNPNLRTQSTPSRATITQMSLHIRVFKDFSFCQKNSGWPRPPPYLLLVEPLLRQQHALHPGGL